MKFKKMQQNSKKDNKKVSEKVKIKRVSEGIRKVVREGRKYLVNLQ